MKRLLAAVILFTTLIGNFRFIVNAEEFTISARSAILIEADSGSVLFEKNSREPLPMASTTKIMTVLLCLESGCLDDEFIVDSEAIKVEGSSMGLQEGDIVTLRDLCCGMLLPSGNDAANAAAVRMAGSIEDFIPMMNSRAAEIGMADSRFFTPSGLDGAGHCSTAFDMALLSREAMKNPDFAAICSQSSMRLEYGNPPYERWLKNTNKLLNMYEGCNGIKTGFTDEAGRCLVSSAERDGVRLICVTLNARDDWHDHTKMLDYGFSVTRRQNVSLFDGAYIPIYGGTADKVRIKEEYTAELTVINGDISGISAEIVCPPFLYAPISAGDRLGTVEYSCNGALVASVPLIAENDIAALTPKKTIFDRIKEFFKTGRIE